jgi:hypothetical protein
VYSAATGFIFVQKPCVEAMAKEDVIFKQSEKIFWRVKKAKE